MCFLLLYFSYTDNVENRDCNHRHKCLSCNYHHHHRRLVCRQKQVSKLKSMSLYKKYLNKCFKMQECRERERKVLFNDALNTFYLRLYGVRHMVKDHSDSEKGNPLPPHRLLLLINSKGSFKCTIPQTG